MVLSYFLVSEDLIFGSNPDPLVIFDVTGAANALDLVCLIRAKLTPTMLGSATWKVGATTITGQITCSLSTQVLNRLESAKSDHLEVALAGHQLSQGITGLVWLSLPVQERVNITTIEP